MSQENVEVVRRAATANGLRDAPFNHSGTPP